MNAPGSSNTTTTVVIAGRDETAPASKSATANIRGVGAAGTQASRDLTQAGAAYVESLQRQADAIGKTRSEIAQMRAQQLGVTQAAAPYIAQLRSQEQAIAKVGVSTAQTAAAMRTLPAQFTDIATQLAGGQSPFLVLLQQGGQVKDSFGGIGPAARALASLITPLRVAIAGTAGAVAALGLAWFQGSKESEGFNKQIALTGGYAGQSTGQLIDMARAIGDAKGNTALAAEALEQLVGSGRIAGSQLQDVAGAAVAFSRATGDAIDDVVKDFVKLADEPTKASAKLNEQYHYLTASVYEQIAALEEQGRKNEAAALAETTFANALKERAASVASSLGVLQRAWNALAADARKAWDAMLDVGRPQSTGEKIASLQKQLDARLAQGPLNEGTRGAFDKGVQALRDQLALLQSTNIEERKFAAQRSEYLQTQEASIKAQDRIRKQIEETATKQEKMNKAVAEAKRDFEAIRKADPNSPLLKEEAKTLENIREKYKDRTPKPKEFRDDAATKMLEQLREQNAAMQAQIELNEKLTTADQERAKFNQLIADLKGKAQLTAEQKSLLANQEAIRAQLDINVATERALELKKKQAEEEKKIAEAVKQAKQLVEATNIRIEASLQGQREQYDRQLSVIGLGSQAAEEVQSVKAIYREFQGIQTSFTKSMAEKGMLGSKEYADEIARIRAGLQEALDLNADYYKRVREEQADWVNGARQATQNYLDDVNNVAKSTEQAFANAYKSIEDGLTNVLTGGKLDAGALGRQFAGEIIRPFVRQNITGPLAEMVQGFLPAKPKDQLGDFIKQLDMAGPAKETAALATSASLATQSVKDLAVAAAAAARSLGGGAGGGDLKSIGALLGTNTGALTTLANALPGDSLDNLFTLTNNFASFDVGTDFVEKDMFARLHKGERVVRAAENVGEQSAGGGNNFYFNVGDVVSVQMLKKALADSQQQAAGALYRRQRYGGE